MTTEAYTIPAERGFYLDGIAHAPLLCGRMTGMAQEPSSPISGGVVVSPCVLNIAQGTSRIALEVKKFGKQSINIQANTVIYNLQQAQFILPDQAKEECIGVVSFPDQFDWQNICTRLSGLQVKVAKGLIQKCNIAFALHDLDSGCIAKTKHGILIFD